MRLVERLTTLCGETHWAGAPCALLRFAGCELHCRWCDTAYARDPHAGTDAAVDELVRWVDDSGLRVALLTGGEPLLQPELPLLASRLAARHHVLVETSGAHDIGVLDPPVIRSVDIKCPDSGEAARNLWSNLRQLRPGDAVKFVLASRADYSYAREVIARYGLAPPVNILLSAAGPVLEIAELAAWIIEDRLADVRLNVQAHKIFWPQLERGEVT